MKNNTEPVTDREIIHTRMVDLPRELVYAACADANHLKHWWGPKGFTNTFHVCEMKPGGAWKYTMHAPDGSDYENESEFMEMEAPGKFVIHHLGPMHEFWITLTFENINGKTKINWNMLFAHAADRDKVIDFVKAANEENIDRLVAYTQKNLVK